MKCALSGWESPYLLEVHPGLTYADNQFTLNTEKFPCCQGQGFRWDEALQVARSCRVLTRKRMVDELNTKFQTHWVETAFPFEISLQRKHFFLTWLQKLHTQHIVYGYIAQSREESRVPSSLWLFALIAVWRFGIPVHVFSMGKSKESDFLPSSTTHSHPPAIYFLENASELWKPERAELVNGVVNWCEQSQVPLWLDMRERGPFIQPASPYDTREVFRARIEKMKARPPLEWLGEDCLSRLRRVCRRLSFRA